MDEQRKFIRYPVAGKVILKPKDGSSRSIKADLIDVSLVGVGVYAQEKIERGVETHFIVMNQFLNNPLVGTGKVRYAIELKRLDTNVFRVGLEFTKVEKEAIQHIINCSLERT